MDIKAINTAIISGNFTATELDSLQDAIKFARSKTARTNAFTFKAGSKAKLTHDKLGGTVVVTVGKIKIKKADVVVDKTGARYSVPLSMLEAV
jgi:5-deoxy-D-glucuronate isomerase